MVTISALNVYPVKSCKGIPLTEASLAPNGCLAFDRCWMVCNDGGRFDGKFVSQRQNSRLALVQPSLPAHVLATGAYGAGDCLTLQAPDMPDLTVGASDAQSFSLPTSHFIE
jgi:uncharacterized protein YcbX